MKQVPSAKVSKMPSRYSRYKASPSDLTAQYKAAVVRGEVSGYSFGRRGVYQLETLSGCHPLDQSRQVL